MSEESVDGVVVLDGAKRIGAKILVSGGGRCNVTHEVVRPEDYQPVGARKVVRNVLAGFTVDQTIAWFEAMGVGLKREETGKIFPVSDDAQTVIDALLRRCREGGVEVRTEHRVREVRREGAGFAIVHEQGVMRAGRVVMATGGKSLPKTGSDGSGWSMVQKLGHTVTKTYAALVPLVLLPGSIHEALQGVSQVVELSTWVDGKRVDARRGSLLWTHFGVSGPVVMDASRFWVIAHTDGRKVEMRCAMVEGTFEEVDGWLVSQGAKQVTNAVAMRLPRRVAEAVVRQAGVRGDVAAGQLPREERRKLVHALTAMVLPVIRDRGWNYAEVTAGGVPMAEVDYRTMESRVTSGLYLVGEILDVEGRIGGFNFQWAWATGYAAGRALRKQVHHRDAEGTEKREEEVEKHHAEPQRRGEE